jgi:hypothetical protein
MSGEDGPELLSHPDRHHPRLAGGLEVRADDVDLAVRFGETDQRDVVAVGELQHRLAEASPILLNNAGEGILAPRCSHRNVTT